MSDDFKLLAEKALNGDETALNTLLLEATEFDKDKIASHDSNAIFNRGLMYETGLGEPNGTPNYGKAAECYDAAMAKGDSGAMVNRGFLYAKELRGQVSHMCSQHSRTAHADNR